MHNSYSINLCQSSLVAHTTASIDFRQLHVHFVLAQLDLVVSSYMGCGHQQKPMVCSPRELDPFASDLCNKWKNKD